MSTEAQRIVRARALMWQHASSDEQAKWLRYVEEFDAQIRTALLSPPSPADRESDGRNLRAVD